MSVNHAAIKALNRKENTIMKAPAKKPAAAAAKKPAAKAPAKAAAKAPAKAAAKKPAAKKK